MCDSCHTVMVLVTLPIQDHFGERYEISAKLAVWSHIGNIYPMYDRRTIRREVLAKAN